MLHTKERPSVLDRPSVALEAHKEEVLALADEYGIYDIRVFGSTARGTDTPRSDVDIFAKVRPGQGYFAVGAFLESAEEIIGFPMDLTIDDETRSYPFDMREMIALAA